jgi:hypothetical protein
MIHNLSHYSDNMSIVAQERRNQIGQYLWLILMLVITSVVAGQTALKFADPSQIAWICFFSGIIAIIINPRNGVYLIVGLSLAGDALLTPWFPFSKNLSSIESLLYAGRALSFSPLEITIALTFAVWILRMAFVRKWEIHFSPLLIPITSFTVFAAIGIAYGFGRGGDQVVGLWESRSLFYLLPLTLLISNLIKTRTHIQILLWAIIVSTAIDGIVGSAFVAEVLKFQLSGVEAIGEHSMSIHFNAFFIIFVGIWMFRGSYAKRLTMSLLLPFVLLAFVANNRRASFICLALALVIVAFALYRFDRKKFWLIIPVVSVMAVMYIIIFWNAGGAIGAPAKALRSVIGQPDPRDAASNVYRDLENINILFTIKSSPLFGVGFGQKFYILIPMPDISFFAWWQYITHNSVLWIWMKMGLGGFLSLLIMIGMAITQGTHVLWRMPGNELGVAALLALCYTIVHFTYAYVDMSWDGPNMVMVGLMFGLIICLPSIADQPEPMQPKRWPWQPDAQPLPELRVSRTNGLPKPWW